MNKQREISLALSVCEYAYNGVINSMADFILELPGEDDSTYTTVVMQVVEDTLFVGFDVVFNTMSDIVHGTDGEVYNVQLLDELSRVAPKILESMSLFMMERFQDGYPATTKTVFTGYGLGGAAAVLIATSSTPHAIYTFGMPAFSSGHIEETLYERVEARANRRGTPASFEFFNFQMVTDPIVRNKDSSLEDLGDVIWWHPVCGWTRAPRFLRWLGELLWFYPSGGSLDEYTDRIKIDA